MVTSLRRNGHARVHAVGCDRLRVVLRRSWQVHGETILMISRLLENDMRAVLLRLVLHGLVVLLAIVAAHVQLALAQVGELAAASREVLLRALHGPDALLLLGMRRLLLSKFSVVLLLLLLILCRRRCHLLVLNRSEA